MQLTSFWPPRRARDRIASEWYYRRNVGGPWLPRALIEAASDLLHRTDRCLEWGSGGSTAWLGKRVGSIRSVEHDPAWFERVSRQLETEGLNPASVQHLSTEPRDEPTASPYVRVIDEFGDGELDVCLVDGEHRSACATAAVPKLSSGGLLILDDAHGFLDHPTTSPHSRYGQGPLDAEWTRFSNLVETWRMIWISDGFSDAALWFKP